MDITLIQMREPAATRANLGHESMRAGEEEFGICSGVDSAATAYVPAYRSMRSVPVTGRRHAGNRASLRACDVVLALTGVILLLPLISVIVLVIVLTDTPHFLFRHQRIGLGGKVFHCLKFRTMAINADEILEKLLLTDAEARLEWQRDHKLRNDPRITRLGRFLRKSSLDELPQLWNVLVGEMSIVGPRPIVRDEIRFYGRYFSAYCSVPPGITGLWQVSGRNDVTYRRRVALDIIYARNPTMKKYLMIVSRTIPAVLLSKGVY